jgi:O-antigen/teichoic acid export membrane protein
LGILFAFISPFVTTQLKPLSEQIWTVIIFAAGVALSAVGLVLDQALVGLLKGNLQLWRNAVFATSKLLSLVVLAVWVSNGDGVAIYLTWLIGNSVSLVFTGAVAVAKGIKLQQLRPNWDFAMEARLPALRHHILNLLLQAPGFALPVLVVGLMGAEANASFYAAWMVAGVAFIIPNAFTVVLYALGAQNATHLATKLQLTLRLSFMLLMLTIGGIFLLADLILELFGPGYASQASWSLRLLSLAGLPMIIKVHYVALCRIHETISGAIRIIAVGAFLEILLPTVGAQIGGLSGLSVGWLAAMNIEALLTVRTVIRAVREKAERTEPQSTRLVPNLLTPNLPEMLAQRSHVGGTEMAKGAISSFSWPVMTPAGVEGIGVTSPKLIAEQFDLFWPPQVREFLLKSYPLMYWSMAFGLAVRFQKPVLANLAFREIEKLQQLDGYLSCFSESQAGGITNDYAVGNKTQSALAPA